MGQFGNPCNEILYNKNKTHANTCKDMNESRKYVLSKRNQIQMHIKWKATESPDLLCTSSFHSIHNGMSPTIRSSRELINGWEKGASMR